MCNRYRQAPREKISTYGLLTVPTPFPVGDVFPRGMGSFIRQRASTEPRELVAGQWGLVPHFAKSPKLTYSTNNARFEGVPTAASYRQPWARGQRCIIPADVFWEPCWESGKNEWWAFRRADGQPWMLAGLWNTWVDRDTGEITESYTMLTQNADAHPLMRRMHKPDPKLGPDAQDKRSVVAIESADIEQWLRGSEAEARELIRLTPAEAFDARPEPATPAAPAR
jgi:putative SOS response-associated peptidase YedK